MKTQTFGKKLTLAKQTISNLNLKQLEDIRGKEKDLLTTVGVCGIFGRCLTEECPTTCGSNIDCSC